MKNPNGGMEQSKAFAIETGTGWKGWAKRRTDSELEEIARRLNELQENFGNPHRHTGLGIRRLTRMFFELRISRELRVVFALIKPRTLRLAMCGNHDEVRVWLRENC